VRGQDSRSGSLFSYVDLEQRVRSDHPLRTIRTLVNEALAALDGRFGEIYSEIGRPSIPPEQLLRAMLLQAFYSGNCSSGSGRGSVMGLGAVAHGWA